MGDTLFVVDVNHVEQPIDGFLIEWSGLKRREKEREIYISYKLEQRRGLETENDAKQNFWSRAWIRGASHRMSPPAPVRMSQHSGTDKTSSFPGLMTRENLETVRVPLFGDRDFR